MNLCYRTTHRFDNQIRRCYHTPIMQEDLRRSAPQEETQALPETRGGLPIPQRLRGRVGKNI